MWDRAEDTFREELAFYSSQQSQLRKRRESHDNFCETGS
jgi:hypothetical protein